MPRFHLDKSTVSAVFALFAFISFVVAGCGGGGGGIGSATSSSSNGSGATTSQASGASLGSMDITVTRDSSGRAAMRNIPSNTASIKITVLSTGAVQTTQFPSDVNTITITVSNIPAGTQSVLIQAVDGGGNVLAQAQISVNIIANGVATAQATLTPVVVPTPSPATTPLNYLYFGAVPSSGSPGIVQIDLNKTLPSSVATSVTLPASPQFMNVVTGANNVPYLYALSFVNASPITYKLFVFNALTMQMLASTSLTNMPPNLTAAGMSSDPVRAQLYIAVNNVSPLASYLDVVDVSQYSGGSVFTPTEQVVSLPVGVSIASSGPAVAVDPTVTGSPAFFDVASLVNAVSLNLEADSYPIGSTSAPATPLFTEPNGGTQGDLDLAYVGTSPVGLFAYQTLGGQVNLATSSATTSGSTPPPLTLSGVSGSFVGANVRFYQPAFLNGATMATALVSVEFFPEAVEVGTLGAYSVTPGSLVVTPVVSQISLPAGAAPDIMAMEKLNGPATTQQAFVADANLIGTVYVVSLANGNPALTSTIVVGANTSIFGITTYQQGLRSTH